MRAHGNKREDGRAAFNGISISMGKRRYKPVGGIQNAARMWYNSRMRSIQYRFSVPAAAVRRHHDEHGYMQEQLHAPNEPCAPCAAGYTHTHGHTHTHTNTRAVINRLSRAIGHLTAVRAMVEEGRDCAEVLVQIAAVRSALNGVCKVILKDHMDHCIVDAVESGDTEAIEALNRAIELLLK